MYAKQFPTPDWIGFYHLFIVVILPSIINGVFNTLIFLKVRSSSRRIHTETSITATIGNSNNRDIHLLKHIFFIFVIFIIGWGPVYILAVADPNGQAPSWIPLFLQILPAFCFLIQIGDLFFYNHELRQYLKRKVFDCFHLNRN